MAATPERATSHSCLQRLPSRVGTARHGETALESFPRATRASNARSGNRARREPSAACSSRNMLRGFVPAFINLKSRPSCGPTNALFILGPWSSSGFGNSNALRGCRRYRLASLSASGVDCSFARRGTLVTWRGRRYSHLGWREHRRRPRGRGVERRVVRR